MPSMRPLAMALSNHLRMLHGLQPASPGPAQPAVEDELAPAPGRLSVDVLEGESQAIGARGLEVGIGKRAELSGLAGGEMRLVLEPEIAGALELGALLALGAAHLVEGVVDELDGVELVEGDLGLGEVVGDALDEGGAHVDAHLLDAGGIAVVSFEIVGELSHGSGVAAVGDVEHAAAIDIDEQGDVVVAAACGGLVDGDALDLGVVGALASLLDPVVEDAPHAGV